MHLHACCRQFSFLQCISALYWLLQVFYLFGAVGLAWTAWWEKIMNDIALQEPEAADLLINSRSTGDSDASIADAVPWRAFLRNTPVRALACTHFVNNW